MKKTVLSLSILLTASVWANDNFGPIIKPTPTEQEPIAQPVTIPATHSKGVNKPLGTGPHKPAPAQNSKYTWVEVGITEDGRRLLIETSGLKKVASYDYSVFGTTDIEFWAKTDPPRGREASKYSINCKRKSISNGIGYLLGSSYYGSYKKDIAPESIEENIYNLLCQKK